MIVNNTRRNALAETQWDTIPVGRTVLLSNYNLHSPCWNVLYRNRRDAVRLKELIDFHDVLFMYEMAKAIRRTIWSKT